MVEIEHLISSDINEGLVSSDVIYQWGVPYTDRDPSIRSLVWVIETVRKFYIPRHVSNRFDMTSYAYLDLPPITLAFGLVYNFLHAIRAVPIQ